MTRPPTPPLLAQLQSPSSPSSQLAALKALKNDLIGHDQRKAWWLGLGIAPPIVRILSASRAEGKRRSKDVNGHLGRSRTLTEEEEARLQAIIIVGSLACGGRTLVTPLLQASAASSLLPSLNPHESPPVLVLATLRTLNTVADALAMTTGGGGSHDEEFVERLFSNPHVHSLTHILLQSSDSPDVQQQVDLVASLIAKTCCEDRYQAALANAGVLDALATRLAGFVVFTGFVLPGAEIIAHKEGTIHKFPRPAPPTAKLHPVLEAIGAIIRDSKLRSMQMLLAPAIRMVFPTSHLEGGQDDVKNPWIITGNAPPSNRNSQLNPIDHILPQVPTGVSKASAQAGAFPPLGSTIRGLGGASWFSSELGSDTEASFGVFENSARAESPLIAWLIHVARAEQGLTRLMAATVLTLLHRAGLTSRKRESGLALLIVPLLVRMFDEEPSSKSPDPSLAHSVESERAQMVIKERAPLIFAMLVTDSEQLQKAAVAAHAIKKLSQMLKKAYDPLSERGPSEPWNPDVPSETPESLGSKESLVSNEPVVSAAKLHQWRVRESTLNALAALAPFHDEFRKMIIDSGVTPFIVDSLKPFSDGLARDSNNYTGDTPSTSKDRKSEGNPEYVLIAACGTVRALSRSVSILRTSLIDAGVALPLFALLKNPDMEVQIAATAAVCNLVLDFSPMREAILGAGVLKVLCEHAHSTNARLRLEAVWALKHLVYDAGATVKVSCVEELGQGWLIQLLCGDSEVAARSSYPDTNAHAQKIGNGSSEQDGVSLHEHMLSSAKAPKQDDVKMEDDLEGLKESRPQTADGPGTDLARAQSIGSAQAKLASLREVELNSAWKARRDDLAIQEQSLDYTRNLICVPDNIVMIDYLFTNLGHDRIFDILSDKLRPTVIKPDEFDRNPSQSGIEPRVIQPQPEIIVAALFNFVHIAAGASRHRQLLMSQTDLLRQLVPLFSHSNKHVRRALAWLIINLTWVDDQADQLNCKSRAIELRKLGFQTLLEGLEHDPDLDVRERTKTALFQMKTALSST
ncbi:MAG: hypothetical protein M1833_006176 [Piccolia ochrophora]|nr:MAG: hypothetical protein M1833_006176 [Piccolia ochrophora]